MNLHRYILKRENAEPHLKRGKPKNFMNMANFYVVRFKSTSNGMVVKPISPAMKNYAAAEQFRGAVVNRYNIGVIKRLHKLDWKKWYSI